MKKLLSYLTLILVLLNGCKTDYKEGVVIVEENTLIEKSPNVIVLDRAKYPTYLQDTIVLRFRTQFSNDSVRICVKTSCRSFFNITTNASTAYSADVPIAIKDKQSKEFIIYLRGLKYRIPIRRVWFFLDVNIDSENRLMVTYSNEILKLS